MAGRWLVSTIPDTEGNSVLIPSMFRLSLRAGGAWPPSESQMAPGQEKQGYRISE